MSIEIKLYMATTVNGYIARKNGEEDFLSTRNWKTFKNLAEEVGCFIIGRKTYQAVKNWDNHSYSDVDSQGIVVTENNSDLISKNFFTASSPEIAVKTAMDSNYNSAILTGGSSLNASFLNKSLVDKIILNIEPYLLGDGIPILKGTESMDLSLHLIETRKITEQIIQIRYEIINNQT